MRNSELKRRFLSFFERKEYKLLSAVSLFTADPAFPFVSSGIKPLEKYFSGKADPLNDVEPALGKPLETANAVMGQRCFRVSDLPLVGDNTHLSSVEMVGAYSFGNHKKPAAIKLLNDFLVNLNFFIDYVTVWAGDDYVPFDKISEDAWNSFDFSHIQRRNIHEGFWGPSGKGGICGPVSGVYVRGTLAADIVFLDYYFPGTHEELITGKTNLLEKIKPGGIAVVAGTERLGMLYAGKKSVFETDVFEETFPLLQDSGLSETQKRVTMDYLRSICFIAADAGFASAGEGAKRVFKEMLLRLFVYEKAGLVAAGFFENIVSKITDFYAKENLFSDKSLPAIQEEIKKGRAQFGNLAASGFEELKKLAAGSSPIDAKTALDFYGKFGLPLEVIREFGGPSASYISSKDFENGKNGGRASSPGEREKLVSFIYSLFERFGGK